MRTQFLQVVMLAGITACTSAPEKPSAETHTVVKENNNLVLHQGKKWQVPAHMMNELRAMERILNTHDTKHHYVAALGDSLQAHLEALTSSCTMEGDAHDELHKWLVPFMEKTDAIPALTDSTRQAEAVHELQQAFVEFNRFFE